MVRGWPNKYLKYHWQIKWHYRGSINFQTIELQGQSASGDLNSLSVSIARVFHVAAFNWLMHEYRKTIRTIILEKLKTTGPNKLEIRAYFAIFLWKLRRVRNISTRIHVASYLQTFKSVG